MRLRKINFWPVALMTAILILSGCGDPNSSSGSGDPGAPGAPVPETALFDTIKSNPGWYKYWEGSPEASKLLEPMYSFDVPVYFRFSEDRPLFVLFDEDGNVLRAGDGYLFEFSDSKVEELRSALTPEYVNEEWGRRLFHYCEKCDDPQWDKAYHLSPNPCKPLTREDVISFTLIGEDCYYGVLDFTQSSAVEIPCNKTVQLYSEYEASFCYYNQSEKRFCHFWWDYGSKDGEREGTPFDARSLGFSPGDTIILREMPVLKTADDGIIFVSPEYYDFYNLSWLPYDMEFRVTVTSDEFSGDWWCFVNGWHTGTAYVNLYVCYDSQGVIVKGGTESSEFSQDSLGLVRNKESAISSWTGTVYQVTDISELPWWAL